MSRLCSFPQRAEMSKLGDRWLWLTPASFKTWTRSDFLEFIICILNLSSVLLRKRSAFLELMILKLNLSLLYYLRGQLISKWLFVGLWSFFRMLRATLVFWQWINPTMGTCSSGSFQQVATCFGIKLPFLPLLILLPSRGESWDSPCGDLAPGRSWRILDVWSPQASRTHHYYCKFDLSESKAIHFFVCCRWTEITNWAALRRTPTLGAENTTCSTSTTQLELVSIVDDQQSCLIVHHYDHNNHHSSSQVSPSATRCRKPRWKWRTTCTNSSSSGTHCSPCTRQVQPSQTINIWCIHPTSLLRATLSIPLENLTRENSCPPWLAIFMRGTKKMTTRSSAS